MRKIVRAAAIVLSLALLAAAGFMALQWRALTSQAAQLEHLVAVSWGDGKYGKAMYGAYVFYDEPGPDGLLTVKLGVRIGRSAPMSSYEHEPRTLGHARDAEEAVALWGVITWSDAGLTVGSGPQAYLFPRDELERHR